MLDLQIKQARYNLKKFWGYDDFRPGQDEVIRAVLKGKNTLALFPTGGGKSLCYQVPATLLEGMTLVISPLVALMQDQVFQLQEKGIAATFVNSTISRSEVEQRLINARNGMYKLLYCAPERLETTLWQNMMADLSLSMIAVDEAHCISEWGHDFRPVYRKIPEVMRPVGHQIRWLALTATATPEVRNDIVDALELKDPAIISRGFHRPNLHWWVVRDEQKRRRLLSVLKRATGSGLIYAGTRAGCEGLSKWLNEKGWESEPYHAGLTSVERERIQNQWIKGSLPLVVATNAFGMGIDKPDCRFVVHYDLSMSIEAYYQEAGRAGRDGKESYPVLLVKSSDVPMAKKRIMDSYPNRSQLKKIYDAVCDHWHLAEGSMMDEFRKVDVEQVQKRSKLSVRLVGSGIRILDQLGILKLTRTNESLIGIRFIPSSEGLQDQLSRMVKMEKRDFIDRLSRMMGPDVHHRMVYMEERQVLARLQMSTKMLESGLRVLENERWIECSIIRYESMGQLSEGRSRRLPVSDAEIMRHRDRILKKFDYMAGYVETKGCRNKYIRIYFGECDVPYYCGKCDNCKKNKTREVNPDDLLTVQSILKKKPMSFRELLKQTRWSHQYLKEVISSMIREEMICRLQDEERRYSVSR